MKIGRRERRKFIRVEASWMMYYRTSGKGEFQRVQTVNVSEGGIRFRSPVVFSPGEMLEIGLWLPVFSEIINFQAKIIWSRPIKNSQKHDTGMAIVEIRMEDRDKLKKQLDAICPAKTGA